MSATPSRGSNPSRLQSCARLVVALVSLTLFSRTRVSAGEPAESAPLSASDEHAPTSGKTAGTSANAGEPDPAAQAEYQHAIVSAIAEFEAGHFAEARALFLRAHELWPSARTFRTIGMTAFELRMYPRALEELQAALDDPRRPLPPEIRAQVASLLQQTRAFVGSYRVERSPPEATLWVDGAGIDSTPESALILAVGVHELRASALGYAELRQTLHVQGREDQTLYVRLEPLPAASTLPPVGGTDAEAPAAPARGDVSRPASKLRRNLAYTAFGLGAAALIASAVTGGLAVARKQTVKKHCPSKACEPPWWDERNELLRFANASTATLAVGAVGIGLGAYFWLTRNARGGAPRPGHISLSPGFGRLSVYGRF